MCVCVYTTDRLLYSDVLAVVLSDMELHLSALIVGLGVACRCYLFLLGMGDLPLLCKLHPKMTVTNQTAIIHYVTQPLPHWSRLTQVCDKFCVSKYSSFHFIISSYLVSPVPSDQKPSANIMVRIIKLLCAHRRVESSWIRLFKAFAELLFLPFNYY